ncbi:MAG: virulence-associated E family protein [Pseudolabrys sp.]|nr:virulence-associated E family protein [Pseudolabrys sp.]MDP2296862.1 virulence-associated E family protein [Pseudolabrys sp.]
MNQHMKPPKRISKAEERVPKHGWDNREDLREAETYLLYDAAPMADGELGKKAIINNARFLRGLGISPKVTAKLLFRKDPKALDVRRVVKVVKGVYESEEGEPGLNSIRAVPREKEDQAEEDARREGQFSKNQFGKPKQTDPRNIKIALDSIGVKLRFDSFQGKVLIEGLEGFGPVLQDDGVRRLRFKIGEDYDFLPEKDLMYEYLLDRARQNAFNPAQEYFDEMQEKWDGKPRLGKFLITYAGAADTPYIRAVGLMPFVAAVRRVREPGAKYDEMLVTESSQGKNKSTAFEIMAVRKEWFTDSFPLNADNRETLEHVQGKLFIECAELQGLRKAEIEHVKALLSRTVDRGRMVWGRFQTEWPRQFVFIGTSNGRNYLKDETGNRRFWPVAVNEFDLDALRRDRDQLWGEAATFEALGESIRLDKSLWKDAAVEQRKRLEINTDPYTDAFQDYLGDRAGKITAADAWAILGLDDAGRRTPEQNKRMGAALKACGWQRRTIKIDGSMTHGYVRDQATKDGKAGHRRIVASRGPDRSVIVEYEDERKNGDDDASADFE